MFFCRFLYLVIFYRMLVTVNVLLLGIWILLFSFKEYWVLADSYLWVYSSLYSRTTLTFLPRWDSLELPPKILYIHCSYYTVTGWNLNISQFCVSSGNFCLIGLIVACSLIHIYVYIYIYIFFPCQNFMVSSPILA